MKICKYENIKYLKCTTSAISKIAKFFDYFPFTSFLIVLKYYTPSVYKTLTLLLLHNFPLIYYMHVLLSLDLSERITLIMISSNYPCVFFDYVICCQPPILSTVSRYVFTDKNLRLLHRLSLSLVMHNGKN